MGYGCGGGRRITLVGLGNVLVSRGHQCRNWLYGKHDLSFAFTIAHLVCSLVLNLLAISLAPPLLISVQLAHLLIQRRGLKVSIRVESFDVASSADDLHIELLVALSLHCYLTLRGGYQ